jgi:hypothetical protein
MDFWDSPWSSSSSMDRDNSPSYHDEYLALPSEDLSSLDAFERYVLSYLNHYRSECELRSIMRNHEVFISYRKKMDDLSLICPRNLWVDLILALYAVNAIVSFLLTPLFIMILFILFKLPMHASVRGFLAPLLEQEHLRLMVILALMVIVMLYASCYCGYLFYMTIYRNNPNFLWIHFGSLPTINYNRFISAYEEINGPVGYVE